MQYRMKGIFYDFAVPTTQEEYNRLQWLSTKSFNASWQSMADRCLAAFTKTGKQYKDLPKGEVKEANPYVQELIEREYAFGDGRRGVDNAYWEIRIMQDAEVYTCESLNPDGTKCGGKGYYKHSVGTRICQECGALYSSKDGTWFARKKS